MTTKPKVRKAPAAKASAPKSAPNPHNTIPKLIARWDFLNAEQCYEAAIVPAEESDAGPLSMHETELDQIEEKLAEYIPDNFPDVLGLLRFALRGEKDEIPDGLALKILANVLDALPAIRRDEMDAARAEAAEKAQNEMRSNIRWAIETMEWKKARNEELRVKLAAMSKAA